MNKYILVAFMFVNTVLASSDDEIEEKKSPRSVSNTKSFSTIKSDTKLKNKPRTIRDNDIEFNFSSKSSKDNINEKSILRNFNDIRNISRVEFETKEKLSPRHRSLTESNTNKPLTALVNEKKKRKPSPKNSDDNVFDPQYIYALRKAGMSPNDIKDIIETKAELTKIKEENNLRIAESNNNCKMKIEQSHGRYGALTKFIEVAAPIVVTGLIQVAVPKMYNHIKSSYSSTTPLSVIVNSQESSRTDFSIKEIEPKAL